MDIGFGTPLVAIEGDTENELGRRDPSFFELTDRPVGRDLFWIIRIREQRSMIACSLAGKIVVVGHQVDGIEIDLHLRHLRMGDIAGRRPGSNAEGKRAVQSAFCGCEALTEFFQEQREVLRVFSAKVVRRTRLTRVFPVDIKAVKLMTFHVCKRTGDEDSPRGSSERHIRKTAGPIPAANRYEYG